MEKHVGIELGARGGIERNHCQVNVQLAQILWCCSTAIMDQNAHQNSQEVKEKTTELDQTKLE